MRNVSFFATVARNVADAATSPAASVPAAAPATEAKPARKLTVRSAKPAKPATGGKPAPVVVKPAKPGKPAEAASAKPAAFIARTAATIARGACNFGGTLSDRDTAYVTFYSSLAKRAAGGVVTVAGIVASERRPAYNGSNKPHDAGVIQRLAKAGLLTLRDGGAAFVFTKAAHSLAAYTAGQR